MNNFWLIKEKEATYLRIIRWAHRNGVRIEDITNKQILEVLKMRNY